LLDTDVKHAGTTYPQYYKIEAVIWHTMYRLRFMICLIKYRDRNGYDAVIRLQGKNDPANTAAGK